MFSSGKVPSDWLEGTIMAIYNKMCFETQMPSRPQGQRPALMPVQIKDLVTKNAYVQHEIS